MSRASTAPSCRSAARRRGVRDARPRAVVRRPPGRLREGAARALVADLAGVLGRAYSVSVFTRWDAAALDQVWVKAKVGSDVTDAEPFPAQWLGGRARGPAGAHDRRRARRALHRAARRPRTLVRPAAALPSRPHTEQRRRAADRVPPAGRTGRRGRRGGRGGRAGRSDAVSRAAGVGDPYRRRRRAVAQPGVPAGLLAAPLHLGPRRRAGAAGGARRRGRAAAAGRPAALGQGLRRRARHGRAHATSGCPTSSPSRESMDPAGRFRNDTVDRSLFETYG